MQRVIDAKLFSKMVYWCLLHSINTDLLLWCKTPIFLSYWSVAPKQPRA